MSTLRFRCSEAWKLVEGLASIGESKNPLWNPGVWRKGKPLESWSVQWHFLLVSINVLGLFSLKFTLNCRLFIDVSGINCYIENHSVVKCVMLFAHQFGLPICKGNSNIELPKITTGHLECKGGSNFVCKHYSIKATSWHFPLFIRQFKLSMTHWQWKKLATVSQKV